MCIKVLLIIRDSLMFCFDYSNYQNDLMLFWHVLALLCALCFCFALTVKVQINNSIVLANRDSREARSLAWPPICINYNCEASYELWVGSSSSVSNLEFMILIHVESELILNFELVVWWPRLSASTWLTNSIYSQMEDNMSISNNR
jgi:hypothetical protein